MSDERLLDHELDWQRNRREYHAQGQRPTYAQPWHMPMCWVCGKRIEDGSRLACGPRGYRHLECEPLSLYAHGDRHPEFTSLWWCEKCWEWQQDSSRGEHLASCGHEPWRATPEAQRDRLASAVRSHLDNGCESGDGLRAALEDVEGERG